MNFFLKGFLFLLLGSFLSVLVFILLNNNIFSKTFVFEGNKQQYQPTNFSLEDAPVESLRGTIATRSGEILWQSRVATESSTLVDDIQFQQGEMVETKKNGTIEVKFTDAAQVDIFENTKVEIVQTLPVNLVFNQFKGKAQYKNLGVAPVSVRSMNLLVNLVEGLMDIDVDDQTGEITVTLDEGQAKVAYNSAEFESQIWDLETGDIFIYDSNERQGFFE
ncbi:hypothetical protein GYA49_04620 [Candidatus Beckwithbacteria bacterium]|nr:hypothetical protein [Candidatus Beckwithbacteria bacterium]